MAVSRRFVGWMFLTLVVASLAALNSFSPAGAAVDSDQSENTPPTVIVRTWGGTEVPGGELASLSGTAVDAETPLDDLTAQWTQVSGAPVELQFADTLIAHFMAPKVAELETFVFRLTVTDEGGLSGSADLEITVYVPDLTPDDFRIPPSDNVLPGSIVYSKPVVVSGITGTAPLKISAPPEAQVYLFINGDDAPDATSVRDGDELELQAYAATERNATVTVRVTVGDGSAAWMITTRGLAVSEDFEALNLLPEALDDFREPRTHLRWDTPSLNGDPPTGPTRFAGQTLKVGDTAKFNIRFGEGVKTFTLKAISEHAYWWVENGVTWNGRAHLDAEFVAAAEFSETHIFPALHAMFGDIPVIAGERPKSHIMFADLAVGGYASEPDWYPQSVYPGVGNGVPAIYVKGQGSTVNSPWMLHKVRHEYTHLLHNYHDMRGEEIWLSEGLATFGESLGLHTYTELLGTPYPSIYEFLELPWVSLVHWVSGSAGWNRSFTSYGAAGLFVFYLHQHYAPDGHLRDLIDSETRGIDAVDEYLRGLDVLAQGWGRGFDGQSYAKADFQTVYADWIVANIIDWKDSPYGGLYGYPGSNRIRQATVTQTIAPGAAPKHLDTPQYGTTYIQVTDSTDDVTVHFEGEAAHSLLNFDFKDHGFNTRGCWYSFNESNQDHHMSRSLTLPERAKGDPDLLLTYRLWYHNYFDWSWTYVEISNDNGETWTILPAAGTDDSRFRIVGRGRGHGYSGNSHGVRNYWANLNDYAGQDVTVRFRYMTTDIVQHYGMCVGDMKVLADDTETSWLDDWQPHGFVHTKQRIRQDWVVRLVRDGAEKAVVDMDLTWDPASNRIVGSAAAPKGSGRIIAVVSPMSRITLDAGKYRIWAVGKGGDTVPDPFGFARIDDAAPGARVVSEALTVKGIDAPAPFEVAADDDDADLDVFINDKPAGEATTLKPGDVIQLAITARLERDQYHTVTVTIGGISAEWLVGTVSPDRKPDPFTFATVTDAAPSTVVRSETVKISGINVPSDISVQASPAAQLRLFVNGVDTTASAEPGGSATVESGDVLQLQVNAAGTPGKQVVVIVTVGGNVGTWKVKTAEVLLPTAHAGPDLAGAPGDAVTLVGSGGVKPDSAAWLVAHLWSQVSGPATVSLDDPSSLTTSFVIPTDTASGSTFVFKLTVTDQRGGSDSDTVSVIVVAPPESESGPDDDPSDQAQQSLGLVLCLTDLGELTDASAFSGSWDDAECRAHHRDGARARYLRFNLSQPATVSVELSSGQSAALFVSQGTPQNGWGTPAKAGIEHRLSVRRANGKLLHEGGASAQLSLNPGQYTIEVVSDADGTFDLLVNPAAR